MDTYRYVENQWSSGKISTDDFRNGSRFSVSRPYVSNILGLRLPTDNLDFQSVSSQHARGLVLFHACEKNTL